MPEESLTQSNPQVLSVLQLHLLDHVFVFRDSRILSCGPDGSGFRKPVKFARLFMLKLKPSALPSVEPFLENTERCHGFA
jgi:hypothetical protein